MRPKPYLTIVAVAVVALAGLGKLSSLAKAEPVQGLFFELRSEAGGIEVRRLRDPSEGVVCYVAKGPMVKGDMGTRAFGMPVAISCLKEK